MRLLATQLAEGQPGPRSLAVVGLLCVVQAPLVASGLVSLAVLCSVAEATNFSWNVSASGNFNDNGNWAQSGFPIDLDGVPDSDDVVTFRRGSGVTYTVTFQGTGIGGTTPVNYVTDRLLVGNNGVTFVDARSSIPPFTTVPSMYTLDNTTTTASGRGIIIGATVSDTDATLTTRLATLQGVAATIGDAAGSNGTLNVNAGTFTLNGNSSTTSADGIELLVGNDGSGTLNVNNGSDLSMPGAAADVWVATAPGSHGTANVNGSGSTWTIGRALDVGVGGIAALNITGGGQVSDAVAALGYDTGSTSTVLVSGSGSTWNTGGDLAVGYSSSGALTIAAGGQVNSGNGSIAANTGLTSTVRVDGAGSVGAPSKWTVSSSLEVGRSSATNLLEIIGGGQVSDSVGYIASADVVDAHGSVTVDGANSRWDNSGTLYVGDGGVGTLNLTNGGRVSSTDSYVGNAVGSNGSVTVDGANSMWTNTQTLRVASDGNGTLSVTNGGEVTSTNGYIAVAAGSIGSASVDGANATWTNAQTLFVGYGGSGTLHVANGGVVTSLNGSIASQSGSSGVASVDSGGSQLEILAQLVPAGQGHFVFTGGSLQVDGSLQVTNGGVVVAFYGGIGVAGLAHIDGANSRWNLARVMDPQGARYGGDLTVNGTLEVSNSGIASVDGLMTIAPQGTAKGDATIAGNVFNGGVTAPGDPHGALHVDGNFTQTSAGKLKVEIGGTSPTVGFDRLIVSGTATLGGTLEISVTDGFVPNANSSFDVLDWGSLSGTFSTIQLTAIPSGLQCYTGDLYTSGVVSFFLTGDYDHSGTVDAGDYIIWRKALGQTGVGVAADGNSDGAVNQNDFDVWRAHFGQAAGSGTGTSATVVVPEPAVLSLLLCVAITMNARSRRGSWEVSTIRS